MLGMAFPDNNDLAKQMAGLGRPSSVGIVRFLKAEIEMQNCSQVQKPVLNEICRHLSFVCDTDFPIDSPAQV
jgi:hypothetical protein